MKKLPLLILLCSFLFSFKINEQKNNPATESKSFIKVDFQNSGNQNFDDYFSNKTMRLDYFHSGMAKENGKLLEEKLKDELPVESSMLLQASQVTHRMVGPDAVSAAYVINK